MPDVYVLTQKDFKQTKNEAITTLSKSRFVVREHEDTPDSSLLADTKREFTKFNGLQYQGNSTDTAALIEFTGTMEGKGTTEEEALCQFLVKQFNKKNAKLILKHYNQLVTAVPFNAVVHSLWQDQGQQSQIMPVSKEMMSCFSIRENSVYMDVKMDSLKIGPPTPPSSGKEFPLPGSIVATFELTEDGFRLKQLAASNSTLRDLCIGQNNVVITQHEVNFATAEEELLSAISDNGNDQRLRTAARAVLSHVIAAKKEAQDDGLLLKVLKQTTAVVKNPCNPSVLNQYEQLTKQVNDKRSWGKIIGGSMLALLGVAVMLVSAALLVHSFGLTSIGLKIGIGFFLKGIGIANGPFLALGGCSLACSGRGRGLANAIHSLFSKTKSMKRSRECNPQEPNETSHLLSTSMSA